MKVFLIFTAVLIPIYINTHAAAQHRHRSCGSWLQTLGPSRAEFIRKVDSAGSLCRVFVGLRMAVSLRWTALVVLELDQTRRPVSAI